MRFTLFITFLYLLSVQAAKDKLVLICKHGNGIKVDYMDSRKGIISLRTNVHADTLQLTIKVAAISKSKSYTIPLSSKVRFIE